MNKVVRCHPKTLEIIKKLATPPLSDAISGPSMISGIRVDVSKHYPRYVRKWEFPKERFVEYESRDEAWAIPLGFGKWRETKEPWIVITDDFRIVHDFGFRNPMGSWNNFAASICT